MRRHPPEALLLLLLLLPLPACGHRGDPLPPLRRTPPAPTEFRFAQRGDVLELSAVAPPTSVDGVAYDALTIEFLTGSGTSDLERSGSRKEARGLPGQRVVATLPLPAAGTLLRAQARGVAAGERGARTLPTGLVVQPPLERPRELAARASEDGVALEWKGLRPKEVEKPSLGPRPGPPGAPAHGAAGPAAPGGTPAKTAAPPGAVTAPPGQPSQETAAKPADPPATPSKAAPATPAQPKPAAPAASEKPTVPATGDAPAAAPAAPKPPAPRRSGFFVYRRIHPALYGEPLTPEPLERRTFVDSTVPLDATACYVVRAVASTDPLIESDPSEESCVERKDISAPATPAGIAVLPRAGGVELLWSPSPEEDLAGYRIFRASGGGEPEKVAELEPTRASWLDESVKPGVTYSYTIQAFDRSGNASEATDPIEGALP
jgi:hypothetical protein